MIRNSTGDIKSSLEGATFSFGILSYNKKDIGLLFYMSFQDLKDKIFSIFLGGK